MKLIFDTEMPPESLIVQISMSAISSKFLLCNNPITRNPADRSGSTVLICEFGSIHFVSKFMSRHKKFKIDCFWIMYVKIKLGFAQSRKSGKSVVPEKPDRATGPVGQSNPNQLSSACCVVPCPPAISSSPNKCS